MPRRAPTTLSTILALAVLAVGCADAGDDPATTGPVSGTSVAVVDNAFEPAALQVEPGDTVTWTWEGSNPHDVSADGFESEVQTSGTFTHTFEAPGEYDYVCTIHPSMTGTIVVGEA